jgi:hypothetical protein
MPPTYAIKDKYTPTSHFANLSVAQIKILSLEQSVQDGLSAEQNSVRPTTRFSRITSTYRNPHVPGVCQRSW